MVFGSMKRYPARASRLPDVDVIEASLSGNTTEGPHVLVMNVHQGMAHDKGSRAAFVARRLIQFTISYSGLQ